VPPSAPLPARVRDAVPRRDIAPALARSGVS
jgi:hypothetical protein